MKEFNLKNYLANNKLLTESLQENTTPKIKSYDEVQVGDIAVEVDGPADDSLGKIIWKGTPEELKNSEYSDQIDDVLGGIFDEDFLDEFDWVVVDIPGAGATLFNYNNDPSGVIVYKDNNSLNEESEQLNSQSTISLPELAEELIEQITNGASQSDVIQILADYLK